MSVLTKEVIKEYQERKEKECDTMGDFKELGRELRDKYDLKDREAIAILNNIEDEIEDIFIRKRQEDDIGKKSDCFKVGTGGGCGSDCPVYERGDCPEPQEIEDEEDKDLNFDWKGGLSDLKEDYTSVELKHEISKEWNKEE